MSVILCTAGYDHTMRCVPHAEPSPPGANLTHAQTGYSKTYSAARPGDKH